MKTRPWFAVEWERTSKPHRNLIWVVFCLWLLFFAFQAWNHWRSNDYPSAIGSILFGLSCAILNTLLPFCLAAMARKRGGSFDRWIGWGILAGGIVISPVYVAYYFRKPIHSEFQSENEANQSPLLILGILLALLMFSLHFAFALIEEAPRAAENGANQAPAVQAPSAAAPAPVVATPGPSAKTQSDSTSCTPDFSSEQLWRLAGNTYSEPLDSQNVSSAVKFIEFDGDGNPRLVKTEFGTWSEPICVYSSPDTRVWFASSSLSVGMNQDISPNYLNGTIFVQYVSSSSRDSLRKELKCVEIPSIQAAGSLVKFQRVDMKLNEVQHRYDFDTAETGFVTDTGGSLFGLCQGPSSYDVLTPEIRLSIAGRIEHLLALYHSDPHVKIIDQANDSMRESNSKAAAR